jgi:hypothetical protein
MTGGLILRCGKCSEELLRCRCWQPALRRATTINIALAVVGTLALAAACAVTLYAILFHM